MIRINLLPRDEIVTRRSLSLPNLANFAPLALVLASFVAIGAVYHFQSRQIGELETIIAQEEAETRELAPQIAKIKQLNQQRKDLNDRLDVITSLDSDRYFRVHLLDELNRSMPQHMWLTRFEEVGGGSFALEGVTFSNFLVSDFLQSVTDSPWFAGVDLLVAEKGMIGEVQVVKFKAQAKAVRKAADPLEG
ncbi:MAG: PilN domain-containing protein [bacterium]|nr:PilN domain-containing protein [bacterium]